MNNAKKLFFIFKLLIVIASFGFIFYKIFNPRQLNQIYQIIQNFSLNQFLVLILVFFLMFLNWSVESIKWKLLIKKHQSISFIASFKAVLSGITISIFTPNRTGEFAGRIVLLKKENRVKAIFSTFTGNIAQLTVTIIFGLLAISTIPDMFNGIFINPVFTPWWLKIVSPLLIIMLLFIYFNIKWFKKLIKPIKFISKYANIYEGLFAYNFKELLSFLLLSIGRYVVFVMQYALLLKVFEVNVSFLSMILVISLIYLTLTIIPSIALGEIGIRSSAAIFYFSKFSENFSGIFMASSFIWIINLAIPALIGSIVFYKMKF